MPSRSGWQKWRREAGACLRLALPLILGQLGLVGMEAADVVMAGHLGGLALAAVGLGVSLAVPIMLLFMGICMAVSPMVAFHVGAREQHRIAPYVAQTLWLALALGVLWWLLYQAAPWLLGLLDIAPQLSHTAAGYVKAMAWGAPGACLMFMLRFMFEGMGRTGPVMLIGLLGLLANIPANYVFMYGALGLPALGAVGAGYGTAVALWLMAAGMIACVYGVPQVRALRLFAALGWPQPRAWLSTLRLGLPVGVTIFLEAGLFGVLGLLMALFGGTAVAAYQVAANFSGVTVMLPLGIALATTARVGQAAGARHMVEARFRGFVGVVLSMLIMIVPLIMMGVFPHWVAGLYTTEPDILALAASLLQLAVLFQLFDGLQVSAAGALRGYKDTRVPMLITLLAYWLVGLPLGWWLGFSRHGGPLGLWWALIVGLGVAAILLIWRYQRVTARAALAELQLA
ncbi:MAG TPA: MATE family efflux transporter [Salinisphaeraceae bacterium]|nr:MATE family efflux transporter [Salinisphaeraceae bacterium]